ncbi:nucleotide kinase domain-containing protein [Pedobacter lithocola]|uniref:Nucleotide kinase domain-containing protein n=1 Tax=Pedobacter lithocola TaxID=1908239 RepID=A0ABV8PE23_9SPHI
MSKIISNSDPVLPIKQPPKKNRMQIHVSLAPAKTTEVFDTYWKFAVLRQEAFFKRFQQLAGPWSEDEIINKFKFTNAYRAADRTSQYLIKEVIYKEGYSNAPNEILFRILLFKLFNKIETWELLMSEFGLLTYKDYDFRKYDKILSEAMSIGERIYSAAYIMPSGGAFFGLKSKHSNHLKLIEHILENKTADKLIEAKSMQQAFEIIKTFHGLGDFLAYQFTVDINYSTLTNFSESSFVVPGPGAKGGISKCFTNTGGLNNVEIIKLMTDRQEKEFERLGLTFNDLWGRKLQLIDCQNLFCEVDKYSRVRHPDIKGSSDRVKIKQIFKSNHSPIEYWFPPKWDINKNIPKNNKTDQ